MKKDYVAVKAVFMSNLGMAIAAQSGQQSSGITGTSYTVSWVNPGGITGQGWIVTSPNYKQILGAWYSQDQTIDMSTEEIDGYVKEWGKDFSVNYIAGLGTQFTGCINS